MSWQTFRAALVFYTCLPLSGTASLDFRGVAAYAPLVGITVGVILGGWDWCLGLLIINHPEVSLLRASLVVLAAVWLTGGLHLDGAMDTADGLAVIDKAKRLQVMADSVTGAYGTMAAIAILLLKTTALTAISNHRFWILIAVAAWGRWGQLYAIAYYPYLKPTGKGKFHQEDIHRWQVWLMAGLLVSISLAIGYEWHYLNAALQVTVIAFGIAWLVGMWLNHYLGGHTGDTYGAVVEWTESLSMAVIALALL